MRVKSFLILGCLSLGALSVGCGGDSHSHGGHGMQGSMIDTGQPEYDFTCSAGILPSVMNYQLDGDFLTLSADAEELVMPRDGSSSGLYDSWLMNVADEGVLESRLYVVIETDTITVRNECFGQGGVSGVAEATSRAIITDSTIETLDEVHDEVEF